MKRVEKTIVSITIKANWVSAAAIVVMMLLTAADIILRFFRMAIPGTYEIVGLLSTLVISFSLGYTSIEKGHIAVDFLVQKLNLKYRLMINALNNLLGTIFFSIVSWRSIIYATSLKEAREVSMTLQIPPYPFVYGIALGSALLCCILIIDFLRSLRGVETT